jgi:hypothetical protein
LSLQTQTVQQFSPEKIKELVAELEIPFKPSVTFKTFNLPSATMAAFGYQLLISRNAAPRNELNVRIIGPIVIELLLRDATDMGRATAWKISSV